MSNSKVLHLRFVGMDSWDRPVYRDEGGILWKDVDPRAGGKPNLCTSTGNEFDGEPDTGMEYVKGYTAMEIVFEPSRVIW